MPQRFSRLLYTSITVLMEIVVDFYLFFYTYHKAINTIIFISIIYIKVLVNIFKKKIVYFIRLDDSHFEESIFLQMFMVRLFNLVNEKLKAETSKLSDYAL